MYKKDLLDVYGARHVTGALVGSLDLFSELDSNASGSITTVEWEDCISSTVEKKVPSPDSLNIDPVVYPHLAFFFVPSHFMPHFEGGTLVWQWLGVVIRARGYPENGLPARGSSH